MTIQDNENWYVTEDEVKNYVHKALDSVYREDVVQEHHVETDDGANYFIDVAIPKKNIAIECKRPRNKLLKKGIGQCIRYEVDGWASYLCTYDDAITANEVKSCMRADVGLIGSTNVQIGHGICFNVYIQNRNKIRAGGNGYLRTRDILRVNHILDILEVNDMEDMKRLKDDLMKVKEKVDYVEEKRYKDFETRGITLPEEQ